jgi:hypothetical protein
MKWCNDGTAGSDTLQLLLLHRLSCYLSLQACIACSVASKDGETVKPNICDSLHFVEHPFVKGVPTLAGSAQACAHVKLSACGQALYLPLITIYAGSQACFVILCCFECALVQIKLVSANTPQDLAKQQQCFSHAVSMTEVSTPSAQKAVCFKWSMQ